MVIRPTPEALRHVANVVRGDDGDELIRRLAMVAGFDPKHVVRNGRLTVQWMQLGCYFAEVLAQHCRDPQDAAVIRDRVIGPAQPHNPSTKGAFERAFKNKGGR